MKKVMTMVLSVLLLMMLIGCKQEVVESKYTSLSYLDTMVSVSYTIPNQKGQSKAEIAEIEKEINENIDQLYFTYHYLSDNFKKLPEQSTFITNIKGINDHQAFDFLQIDFELYQLLKYAAELEDVTEGYFNISIGRIIDAWKSVIEQNDGQEVSSETFEALMAEVEMLEVVEDGFELKIENNQYFVRRKNAHVKLDLGALAKGYVTQKVEDYLKSKGVILYSISSGSSSIVVGKKSEGKFRIGLKNPIQVGNYGRVELEETGITTSGNYEQFFSYQGRRYHHIISPKAPYLKQPANFFHTVTLIGKNAGLLDAVSTALYSMPFETMKVWIETHHEAYGIEAIVFKTNAKIESILYGTTLEVY